MISSRAPSLPLGTPILLCEPVSLLVFDATCQCHHAISVLLWLSHFTWHNNLRVLPRSCRWQDFLPFVKLNIAIHRQMIVHLSMDTLVTSFFILGVVDSAEVNIGIYFIHLLLVCLLPNISGQNISCKAEAPFYPLLHPQHPDKHNVMDLGPSTGIFVLNY